MIGFIEDFKTKYYVIIWVFYFTSFHKGFRTVAYLYQNNINGKLEPQVRIKMSAVKASLKWPLWKFTFAT